MLFNSKTLMCVKVRPFLLWQPVIVLVIYLCHSGVEPCWGQWCLLHLLYTEHGFYPFCLQIYMDVVKFPTNMWKLVSSFMVPVVPLPLLCPRRQRIAVRLGQISFRNRNQGYKMNGFCGICTISSKQFVIIGEHISSCVFSCGRKAMKKKIFIFLCNFQLPPHPERTTFF